MVSSRDRSSIVDTLYDTRKSLRHIEEIVHHLLPAVDPLRIGFSQAITTICTHLLIAGRDMTSLIELVAAMPVEDEPAPGPPW